MSPSRRGSPKSASRARRYARRFRASSGFGGCGRRGGSPPPTPCTKEKKSARPVDRDLRGESRVGHGLRGRVLVEPGGAPHPQRLERGWRTPPPPPADGRQERPRAEGHLLLRAPPPGDR